jgi:outer membrane protein OmpA-like peptidoglycan-associated protein
MKNLFITLFVFVLSAMHGIAQKDVANKLYDKLAYGDAIAHLEKAAASNHATYEVWQRLASSYHMTNQPVKEEYALSNMMSDINCTLEERWSYIEVLMRNKNYSEAKKMLDEYALKNNNDTRIIDLQQSLNLLANGIVDNQKYICDLWKHNSDISDLCPVITPSGIVFTSARTRVEYANVDHGWTGSNFHTMWIARGDSASQKSPIVFANNVQGSYYNGPATFNANGDFMVYTRSQEWLTKQDEMTNRKLKLYYSTRVNNTWSEAIELSLNESNTNNCHPALSADGKMLFFASDRPGGCGGMDLWYSTWNNGQWTEAVNAGNIINTASNELFPQFAPDGSLTFSSNGHISFGGLDILKADVSNIDKITLEHLDAPFNSSDDDFGITYHKAMTSGYFTSNRGKVGADDDIYKFYENRVAAEIFVTNSEDDSAMPNTRIRLISALNDTLYITTDAAGVARTNVLRMDDYTVQAVGNNSTKNVGNFTARGAELKKDEAYVYKAKVAPSANNLAGRVYKKGNNEPLQNVLVLLEAINSDLKLEVFTDELGNFIFENLDPNFDYKASVVMDECGISYAIVRSVDLLRGTASMDIPVYCMGDVYRLGSIYFGYNQSNIRRDAQMALDELTMLMLKYPSMEIELDAHTDTRGSAEYNLTLSQQRAEETMNYLMSNGVQKARLSAKGLGETMPLRKCIEDVDCTEDDHAWNRRTEFLIKKM